MTPSSRYGFSPEEAPTDAELAAAGVPTRRASVIGWIAIVVLASLAVFVWTFAQWVDLQKARDFHAFESGLVRICGETHGVYTRGACKAPDVAFEFSPLDIQPHDGGTVGLAPRRSSSGETPPL